VIRWSLLVLALALATLPGCSPDEPAATPTDRAGAASPTSIDPVTGPNAVMVRVVDGDTIVVDIEGREERVRLIGIDTPESVAEERPDQCYGVEASDEVKRLLPPGTELILERDVEPRDQYERLLAYVYRVEDQLFINETLVRDGFAGILSYPPNDTYAERFRSLETTARQEGTGLWGACGGPDEPLE
jgi:micrococcal nuclease